MTRIIDPEAPDLQWLATMHDEQGRIIKSYNAWLKDELQGLYRKYSPDEARNPAGSSGGGEWTGGGQSYPGDAASSREHLSAPSATSALPQKLQDKMNKKLADMGLTREQMAAHMDEIYKRAMAGNGWQASKDWYRTANAECLKLASETGTDPSIVYAITAKLSPIMEWGDNLALARDIVTRIAADSPVTVTQDMADLYNNRPGNAKDIAANGAVVAGTFPLSGLNSDLQRAVLGGFPPAGKVGFPPVAAALVIAETNGADMDLQVGGPKVRSFYNNIANPDDPRSTTVDTWMYRAMADAQTLKGVGVDENGKPNGTDMTLREHWDAMGDVQPKPKAGSPQNIFQSAPSMTPVPSMGLLPIFADTIHAEAAKNGLLANEYQAIVWDQIRNEANAGGYWGKRGRGGKRSG